MSRALARDREQKSPEGDGASRKMRNLTGLVILATQGRGYKAVTLREPDRVSANQMIATLNREYYRDFVSQCDGLRGQELTALVTAAFNEEKEYYERQYKKIQERDNQKK